MSADAVALKDQGNKAFAAGDWPTAVDFYTKAIAVDGTQPTFFTNRAQVRRLTLLSASNCFRLENRNLVG